MNSNETIPGESAGIIFIVDDSSSNRQTLTSLIKYHTNYSVIAAKDALTAMDSVFKETSTLPDLFLLDILMPGVNGYEMARELKNNPRTTDIPIIFITSLSEESDLIEGFKAGAADYVVKPFSAAEVISRINVHIRVRKLQKELKQKNKEIESKNKYLNTVIESLAYPFFVINVEDCMIELANTAANMLYPFNEPMPCYEYFYRLKEPCTPDVIACPMCEMKKTGQPVTIQKKIDEDDGREHIFDIYNYPMSNETGKLTHMISYYVDITDKKKAEEELRQFVYVASHDLKEPLRMINSYLQLLEKRYGAKLDQDAQDFIRFALDGGHRMQELMDDLLELSRVHTRSKPFETIDMNESVLLALSNLKVALEESDAQVDYAELPQITGDLTQMVQLFQNLIGNGVKYRNNEIKPEIVIGFTEKSEFYHFFVQDNGIGMEETDYKRIFQPFTRLHTRDEYPGTGIGLAICKEIVQRHLGSIWVESVPEKGSTFRFSIPKPQKKS